MVKCSDILKKVISDTMDDFDQPSSIKQQYEKLFENLIIDNAPYSDITRLIENIEVGDD